jgi:valyl-tRNA synthetase
LMATYKLVWDDFCAWYLEAIKPDFIDGKAQPIDKATFEATINYLEKLLVVMHPWMPFITEEIWHLTKERDAKDCCIVAKWPELSKKDEQLIDEFETLKELITTIRNVRAQKQISPKEKLVLISRAKPSALDAVIIKLANLSELKHSKEKVEGSFSFVVKNNEFFIPLSMSLNVDEERGRLLKEIDYNKGFLKSVQSKLANEKFVANAKPELVELERKKAADAIGKIKTLEDQLSLLK